ncbi:MAG: hypothetical protein ACE5HE_13605 [Phycisphaerae bacterium]
MKVDSLDELTAAFDRWRRKKRHVRERVPGELWERALWATRVHGTSAVARATKLERSRLVERDKKASKSSAAVAAFSRLSITAPSAGTYPIAEVETATGLKLRIFTQTQETLSVLSSLCGIGAAS